MIDLIFLDKDIFNNEYLITGMANNSLILTDKQSSEQVLVHRRVLNAILKAKEPIPCTVLKRMYLGREDKWLATLFSK